jgi:hypothetical protein
MLREAIRAGGDAASSGVPRILDAKHVDLPGHNFDFDTGHGGCGKETYVRD